MIRLSFEDGQVLLSSADKSLAKLRELAPTLSTESFDEDRRAKLIGQHPLGSSFFINTGLPAASTEDLLIRLLVSSPRWLVEDEIPGAKVNGRPCELRFICIYDGHSGQVMNEAHYGKIGGNEVGANLSQGGTAISSIELVKSLTAWSTTECEQWLRDTGTRASALAE